MACSITCLKLNLFNYARKKFKSPVGIFLWPARAAPRTLPSPLRWSSCWRRTAWTVRSPARSSAGAAGTGRAARARRRRRRRTTGTRRTAGTRGRRRSRRGRRSRPGRRRRRRRRARWRQPPQTTARRSPGRPNQQHTVSKLLTEFRCRNFVNKHRLSIRMGVKRAKTCTQCVHVRTELPFCIPPLVVGK